MTQQHHRSFVLNPNFTGFFVSILESTVRRECDSDTWWNAVVASDYILRDSQCSSNAARCSSPMTSFCCLCCFRSSSRSCNWRQPHYSLQRKRCIKRNELLALKYVGGGSADNGYLFAKIHTIKLLKIIRVLIEREKNRSVLAVCCNLMAEMLLGKTGTRSTGRRRYKMHFGEGVLSLT